jgi:RHS repeat-associated protein
MKKYYTLLLVLATINQLYCQDFNLGTSFPEVTKPEPSISSLMKFEEIPVSNYTGVPDINVPIFNLPTRSKDISLNLSLGYHPSSVAMDEFAGECGLGWSLFAGGVITRDLIGSPDEYANGYTLANKNDIYQFNFMGHIGRFYLIKDTQGVLNVKILENVDSKLVITVSYNTSTYVIDSFIVYDDKGYRYVFQDYDTQTYSSLNPVCSYKSSFHLTKVTDNNNKDLINFNYDTYTQVVNASYSNLYKKCRDITSNGYGKVNFIYSNGANYTYNSSMKITELDLADYNGVLIKKEKFSYQFTNLIKIENCNPTETIKEPYEFKYKINAIPTDGTFIPDDWGYRKYVPNCLFGPQTNNLDSNISTRYCDIGVLTSMSLPTGGSINYNYESNTYSDYSRNASGNWELNSDPNNYYYDNMPENYTITPTYHEFTGNGANTYSFTVPTGTGNNTVPYYFNVSTTPYTIASSGTNYSNYIGDPNTIIYPSLSINGQGIYNKSLTSTNNTQNLCQGEQLLLYRGQTYTITIATNGNANCLGMVNISTRNNKPNPNMNMYGAGIRIKQIAYFDKKVVDYFNNTSYYSTLGITPSKQKSYSYNFFQPNLQNRSSGAAIPTGYDNATNSRIKREPVGYKNVTVTEEGCGKEEFTYTSPMDFTPPPVSNALNTIYYDYRRGLLTKKSSYNLNSLLVDINMTYGYVETADPTVFYNNPALNERLGWAYLQHREMNYYSNSILPKKVIEDFEYNTDIRKLATKTTTYSTDNILKTAYTYHTGNSIYSQNRIGEIERVDTYRNGELLFSKKINYYNVWNNNGSYLPNTIQGAKGSQTLENSYSITGYDDYSNPTEKVQSNGIYTTYLWGYNKTKLIAKIENASNTQVATALGLGNINSTTEASLSLINALRSNSAFTNALITTYTYKPLVGISTITDPKGDMLSYEYDDFNRLKAVRDKNNKILTETLYYQALNDQDLNAVTNIVYKTETTTSIASPAVTDALQNKTFIDGLGRPIQEIAYQQSGANTDIVKHIEYDNQGRIAKDYLPYANTTSSLNYNPNAKTELLGFEGYTGQNPFVEKRFDNSPLSRVLEVAAPGSDWSMTNTVPHTIRYDYQNNLATDNVRKFTATSNFSANTITLVNSAPGNYLPNELSKIVVKNENWKAGDNYNNTTETYKDKEGRVVLSKTYGSSIVNGIATDVWHETYTVYDQYGNVTFVIPPKADGQITQTVLDELCYQYKYDYRNRLIEKKLPGKQWEFIVYDKLNRIVATGPALSPFTDYPPGTYGWLITKYDALNRPILTAWMTGTLTSAGRSTLQSSYTSATLLSETKTTSTNTINGVVFNYSTAAFPTTGYHILTLNYYDDYNTNLVFTPAISYTTSIIPSQPVYYNNTAGTLPKGLPTISWVRVPETTSTVRAEKSYVLYDAKARVVRTFSNNYLEGYTQVDSQLQPITGRLNHTQIIHKRAATNATLITLNDFYTYTSQDRLLGHTHTIDTNNPTESLVQNTYDKLGRLITKNVGGTGTAYLQKVDYSYNIRGWLTGINDPNNLAQNSAPLDLFAFAINYNTPIANNNDSGTITPLYNGNIAATSWRTATDNILRRYGYQYDNLNRLINASYQKPEAAVPLTSSYDETTTYDKNGNIMSLSRYGDFDDPTQQLNIDDLTYSYANMTNRLMKVTDATNSTIGFKEPTIPNTANSGNDYTYDVNPAGTDIGNGNMTSDYNKGITNIKYNHLNLPIEISFTGTNKINYLYNATGKKLKKVVTSGTTITTTDYLDGFQYNQATATAAVVLQFFPQAEGYVSNTVVAGVNKYSYIYNYTDHLGNVRLSYTKNPNSTGTTPLLTILEESHYYPSGIKHTKYNIDQAYYLECGTNRCIISTPRLPYQYKYNGQEWQDELGLNTTAMDYRQYDNTIGRFSSIDPLAEKTPSISGYAFANNNPIIFADPSGLKSIETNYGHDWLGRDKFDENGFYITPDARGQAKQFDFINFMIGGDGYNGSGNLTQTYYKTSDGSVYYKVYHEGSVTPRKDNLVEGTKNLENVNLPFFEKIWISNISNVNTGLSMGLIMGQALNESWATAEFTYGARINGMVRSAEVLTRSNRISSIASATRFAKLGFVSNLIGTGFAATNIALAKIEGKEANNWDIADFAVGSISTASSGASLAVAAGILDTASLGSAAFLVSNPVGWGIAIGTAAYFGYRAYESYYGN